MMRNSRNYYEKVNRNSRKFFFAAMLIFFSAGFFSCNNSTAENGKTTTADNSDTISKTDTAAPVALLAGKPVSFWLQSSDISATVKKILKEEKDVNVNTWPDVDRLGDTITKVPENIRAVYFYAFTRTLKLADGAYAEAASDYCKKYMETESKTFCHYFSTEAMLKIEDIETWARLVFAEIQIENENHEKDAVIELGNKIGNVQSTMNEGEIAFSRLFVNDLQAEEGKFMQQNTKIK